MYGRCSINFPKNFIRYTEQGNDNYQEYRRRSLADGGLTGIVRRCVNGVSINQVVQNDFVVPYNP